MPTRPNGPQRLKNPPKYPTGFDRWEKHPRFKRWVTLGPWIRYALLTNAPDGAPSGLRWAAIHRSGKLLEESQGCFYRDHNYEGQSAELAATLAVRKVLRKERAYYREQGWDRTPIVGKAAWDEVYRHRQVHPHEER